MMAPNTSPAIIKRNKSAKQFYGKNGKIDQELVPVINMTLSLATYYIPYHLRSCCKHESLQGLPKNFVVPPAQVPELFCRVADFSHSMEQRFSSFFEQVPTVLKLKNENAKHLFISLSRKVVESGVNWGRLVGLFALGGSFAVHFVNIGQLDTVKNIPSWIQEVIVTTDGLASWIQKQGGWERISLHSKDDLNNGSWSSYVTVGCLAAAGMIFYLNK